MLRTVGPVIVAAVMAAAPAAAQDGKPIQLTIGGGYTGVYGAAKDRLDNGGNFTIGLLFRVNPIVSLQGEYGWNGFKKKTLSLPVSVNPLMTDTAPTDFSVDGNMQYGDFNVMLHPKTPGKVQPYGLVGVGVYYRPVNVSSQGAGYTTICDPWLYVCYPDAVSIDQVVGSRNSTDFGMNFGGGVNFKVSQHVGFYVEARYHYIWGPSVASSNVPTVNPLAAGSDVSSTLKANGKFVPITVGFRF